MKKLILTSVLTIISIIICVLSLSYVNTISQNTENYINNIQTLVSSQQYKSAITEINNLNKYWHDNQNILSMILDHEILEEIEESLGLIKSSLEHPDENDTNFWLETARSLVKINNLKNTEEPSLANIL